MRELNEEDEVFDDEEDELAAQLPNFGEKGLLILILKSWFWKKRMLLDVVVVHCSDRQAASLDVSKLLGRGYCSGILRDGRAFQ